MPKYTVNIKVKRGLGFPFKKAELKNVVEEVLSAARVNKQTEVDCLITDNTSIHRLNRLYRGIDSPTDVLSFRFAEKNPNYESINFPAEAEAITPIGEIIISYPRAVEQANQQGNAVKQEIYLLLVHGTLHLLGYDHINNADARNMRLMENRIIKFLNANNEGSCGTTI